MLRLVRTGKLPSGSPAVQPAFESLSTTSAADLCALSMFPRELLVTKDFIRTVKIPSSEALAGVSDLYQKPIQWVLSTSSISGQIKNLIILSPHEANELIEDIRTRKKVTLHLFAPRYNASFEPIDNLELFNIGRAFSAHLISRSLTMQLNLFAGSLYLRSYAEYIELCEFLGLSHGKTELGQQTSADGFIMPPSGAWKLTQSPVPFLRALLMTIRKEGEGIGKTTMGRILTGARLEERDFEGMD